MAANADGHILRVMNLGAIASGLSNLFAASSEKVPAGGTAGQVLAKASGTDNDVEWATPATYSNAVASTGGSGGSAGLMSANDKETLDSIATWRSALVAADTTQY